MDELHLRLFIDEERELFSGSSSFDSPNYEHGLAPDLNLNLFSESSSGYFRVDENVNLCPLSYFV